MCPGTNFFFKLKDVTNRHTAVLNRIGEFYVSQTHCVSPIHTRYKFQSNTTIVLYNYIMATCFDCIESSSGLLKNRSNVSTFVMHSGIPKASSSSLSEPGAYAPGTPQPMGLLFDPCPTPTPVILDVPTSAARRLHVHMTREILAAKGGTVGENVGQ